MVMKANELMLQNLLDINPRTGTITLHDERMVLLSVESLGILRSDLINTLGYERAKGFLMRYGWSCGYKEAETLKNEYEWKSLEELLLAGPAMHTLAGVVTVEPDVLEIEEDKLYFSGYWKNSFEADEHISKHGINNEAACWSLLGYASGYLTKIFGQEVVANEKYCRAKGDSACYFVAKTVAHSEKEHLKDLRYYQTESLQSVLEDVYMEMEQLNEDIIESEKVQNELTELFLEDKDINEITEMIGKLLKRSIVINHFSEVYSSYFECDKDKEDYDKWLKSRGVTNVEDYRGFESFSIKSHKIVLGRMIVIGHTKLDKREQLIINRALMVFTIQMYHQRKMTESLWKKREDFFDEIIDNKIVDDFSLKRQAAIFGFKPNERHQIMAIKFLPKEMKEEVLNFLTKRYSNLDLFMKDGYIVMIIAENQEQDIERLSSTILDTIQRNLPDGKIYIGSGRCVETIQMMNKSYMDATRICDFVQLTYPISSRQASFKELEPIMMFLKGSDQKELIKFYSETIGSLVKYDTENQGSLLITLKSYLDNNGNLQQTADELHLSIAGLRYRIERIESLSDIDLKTGSGRFKCQLATRIYFVLKVMNM
ncbi:XylR N-terminal domain-containing protein [Sporosarcina limicola]|uniref:Sugar diacid utilization regulator/predicted hydrocarbon binding protein n=1 Tax=Sporosarcina limicola TaxID=34101 RepID=A0A927R2U1_9BACL|nr:XylR N-terminal domain-containing protein [Sporosarcina limicola]MBE1554311.1 sugar diacid utilization regulator/predicted hydrocarbon binding protein [Sporosarcina limicola]